MLGAPAVKVRVGAGAAHGTLSDLCVQSVAGLTIEEQLTMELLGSCAALQALVSAGFYRQAAPQTTHGAQRFGFPIE